eukprot:jgi/Tetstr1/429842/TSEL_019709.t1
MLQHCQVPGAGRGATSSSGARARGGATLTTVRGWRPWRAAGLPQPATREFQARQVLLLRPAKAARAKPCLRAAVQANSDYAYKRRDYGANAVDKLIFKVGPSQELPAEDVENCFDYPRNLEEKYKLGDMIGSGNYGVVYKAVDREAGLEYACKTVSKVPRGKGRATPHHLLKIRAEVDCMSTLGASLDAVFLKDVFEDEGCVHLVMELCKGGVLLEERHVTHFTEAEVAHLMRSVFRFLAQCHSKGIVFRDVKPGNFLFTTTDPATRRLKATDFGLAVEFAPGDSPLTTPAGTPIYIAPEVIMKRYGTEADIYSAGVMCFQLLTGRYPYWPDMHFRSPTMKELFGKICKEEIDFSNLSNEGVSEPAQEFLQVLLQKNRRLRPTATEALRHPWLRDPALGGIAPDTPLEGTAVQRLQRFAVHSHLKQHVLTMMANDMLSEGAKISPEQQTILSDLRELFQDEMQQLMSKMDVNGDGTVEIDEFVTSLLDWHEVQNDKNWRSMVRRVFDRLDLNGDGSISLEELVVFLYPESYREGEGDKVPMEEAMHMMRDFDDNDDGRIQWEEFYAALSEGNTPSTLDFFDHRLVPQQAQT